MRFPLYSLKTGIAASLSLLIISAMLLINLVLIRFSERDLIDARTKAGSLLLQYVGQRVGYEMAVRNGPGRSRPERPFRQDLARALRSAGFSRVMAVGRDGSTMVRLGSWGNNVQNAAARCMHAMRTGQSSVAYSGEIWGVVWFGPERLQMTGPLVFNGRTIGAAAVETDLLQLYQHLRASERVVLGYILLNTIVMVLLGIFLLSRTVIKPIHRLLTITEKFDEWPALLTTGESSRSEFGQLFRSLKMMLNRLQANKQELQENIASLEKANLEIKKAQEDMVRSEKMATAGRLATGVAHEIGNPLGIILGYLELLKRSDLASEEREDFVERIEAEVNRIHHIIRELLDFSRPADTEDPEETAVHAIITETLNMLKPQPMMEPIDVASVFRADADRVRAGASQLKQVFLNIIINAADAMADGPAPSRATSPNTLTIETWNSHGIIVVSFTDTGSGLPADIRDRIFDPFYTTKEPGKGTGLGLSVCYTIMEGLGGAIRAESPSSRGTRIIIEIPLAPEH